MSDLTPEQIASTINARNVVVEVEPNNEFDFRYFSPGPEVSTTENFDGRVTLGGNREPRSYVYTWLTPFGEESIPSQPTESVFLREGEPVVVDNLPTQPPQVSGFVPNMIRGIRLYRSLTTPSGGDFFRLATLWFPNEIIRAGRQNDVVTVETQYPHALVVGDRVNIPSGFFATGNDDWAEVTRVDTRFRFSYEMAGPDQTEIAVSSQTMYYDISENEDDPPRWWGRENYLFRDDFDGGALTTVLPSLNYEAPPLEMRGLTLLPNNIMAGFVGSRLYLSEPNEFHAFPSENTISFDYDIVGLAVSSGTLVVLTKGYPYRVDGNTPESMTPNKVDSMYPCLSEKSIVVTGTGVTYATHSGLATYNPGRGATRATRFVLSRDEWKQFFIGFDPANIHGFEYEDKYIAIERVEGSEDSRAFVFEPDEQTGGQITFLTLDEQDLSAFITSDRISARDIIRNSRFEFAGWTDPGSGNLYLKAKEQTDFFANTESVFSNNVRRVAYTQDRSRVFVLRQVSSGPNVFVYDTTTGVLIDTVTLPIQNVGYNTPFAVSHDGNLLAFGDWLSTQDLEVPVYNTNNWELLTTLTKPEIVTDPSFGVAAIEFSPPHFGRIFISITTSYGFAGVPSAGIFVFFRMLAQILNPGNWTYLRVDSVLNIAPPQRISVHPSGSYLAIPMPSAQFAPTVFVRDLIGPLTFTLSAFLNSISNWSSSVAFSRNGQYMVVTKNNTDNNNFFVVDVSDIENPFLVPNAPFGVDNVPLYVSFTENDTYMIVTFANAPRVAVYSTSTWLPIAGTATITTALREVEALDDFSAIVKTATGSNLFRIASTIRPDVILSFDDGPARLPYVWSSKQFKLPEMRNLGAARIKSDVGVVMSLQVNGDELVYPPTLCPADEIFRLPAGYKTDRFRVSLSGTLVSIDYKVRAIHLGETPYSLRGV